MTTSRARRPVANPVASLFARKLQKLDEELGAAIPRVDAGGTGDVDEEAIHDLRVAIRRLRTLLKVGRRIYGREIAHFVRLGFTVVHRSTGELRDEEVLHETLALVEPPDATDAAVTSWRERRLVRERRLRAAIRASLRAGVLVRARATLEGLILHSPAKSGHKDVHAFVRSCVERARRGVEKLRGVPVEDVEGLHELRIAYKELRYAIELFTEALPADLAALAEPAARFQKRLGEIHDVDMALAVVAKAPLAIPVRTRLTRALAALRSKRVEKYVVEMAPPLVVPAVPGARRPPAKRPAAKRPAAKKPAAKRSAAKSRAPKKR